MPEKQYFTGIDVINGPRIESLTVTEDGTYTASSGVIGYNPVVVNTNQPWTPLEDGYSNFWFELTDDTLSPWLNFSAKTESAVIDWGDGSGEVALDTLTPTHTYSKAGRYVVKVKGVTGIGRQFTPPYSEYTYALKNVELNDDVTTMSSAAFSGSVSLNNVDTKCLSANAFSSCGAIKTCKIRSGVTAIPLAAFYYNISLKSIYIPNTVTTITGSAFYYCSALNKIIIPASVTDIGNSAFVYCLSLTEIHCLPTTPPTLGTSVFLSLPSDFIIYVPVGYGDTYKAESGWSTYADHILEEGQTPNRAMLAKFNSDNTDNEEMR